MNETLLVVFFIVLIIAIGSIVYFRYFLASAQEDAASLNEQEMSVLLASITGYGELSCGNGDCIDMGKVLAFSEVLRAKPEYYLKELGYKKITISIVYPPTNATRVPCELRTYQQTAYPNNCGFYLLYDREPRQIKQRVVVGSSVSLYYPEFDAYRIGRITIESYA